MREREREREKEKRSYQAASKSGLNPQRCPLFTRCNDEAAANVRRSGVSGAPPAAGQPDHRGSRLSRRMRSLRDRRRSRGHRNRMLGRIPRRALLVPVRGCRRRRRSCSVGVFGGVVVFFSVRLHEAPSSFLFWRLRRSCGGWRARVVPFQAEETPKPLWCFAHLVSESEEQEQVGLEVSLEAEDWLLV
jgi:hypothetical protein